MMVLLYDIYTSCDNVMIFISYGNNMCNYGFYYNTYDKY